jgi:hypothetical protein
VNALIAIIPMAFVMIAGPQIVTAIFLATSEKPVRNSLAYLAAVALATTLGVTLAYFLTHYVKGLIPAGSPRAESTIDWTIIVLLTILAIRVYMRRKVAKPPAWMAKLQSTQPKGAFILGLSLFTLMPGDIIAMLTVGTWVSHKGLPWVANLAFVAVTLLFAGVPFIIYLLLGKRAETVLPAIREWMTSNAWIVSEVVVLFFIGMSLSSALKGG